jgi:Transposase DDE domain
MIDRPSHLHNQLIKFAGQYSQWSDLRHLGVMCWMMIGLIVEGKVNLTKWIDHVCSKAQIAQSTQRRLSRWVNNPRINPAKLYSPVVKAVFANWRDSEIYLSFDTSMLWDEYCIIRICVVHLGRAIPVGWRVLKHKSSSVKIDTYQDLLKRISKLLPVTAKVILLADRGFANAELIRYVRQLGWHCRIRIKGNFWLRHPRQGWQRASQFPVAMGEAKLIHNVQIHKCNSLTDVHLAIAWESTSGEHWYIISTEPTTLQTFREYGFRFTIEENFLDDKSSGFNLEDSKLRSAPALSRLCLVLAMTTLFLTAQGVQVVVSGLRRYVDPHWFRGSSYLKIGWSWVKQSFHKGWNLISVVSFVTNIDPDPVKASLLQHQQRTYRIEFKATTHIWAN